MYIQHNSFKGKMCYLVHAKWICFSFKMHHLWHSYYSGVFVRMFYRSPLIECGISMKIVHIQTSDVTLDINSIQYSVVWIEMIHAPVININLGIFCLKAGLNVTLCTNEYKVNKKGFCFAWMTKYEKAKYLFMNRIRTHI